jgi:glycosyltransferase involved in cell wall biosynthesis
MQPKAAHRPLRIAQVAPPLERVPPVGYGGTERVIDALVVELLRRGHEVTTFASADSDVPGDLVPTVPVALRPAGDGSDPTPWFVATLQEVRARAGEFDLIHAHLETYGALLTPSETAIVHTFHGRLDYPSYREVLPRMEGSLVAISASQARPHPDVPWAAVIHNGLDFGDVPAPTGGGPGLCFVGRVAPEKGILDAIEVAHRTGRPLRIAAKIGTRPDERAYHERVFRPALKKAGHEVEFLGELEGADRDRLYTDSFATLMPGAWPEPFGLVAIESLARGTPVIARAVGASPEIIVEGRDGFFGDDVQHLAFQVDRCAGLDRTLISASALERFSATRMADDYEALYRRILSPPDRSPAQAGSHAPASTIAREAPAATSHAGSQGLAERDRPHRAMSCRRVVRHRFLPAIRRAAPSGGATGVRAPSTDRSD